MICEPETERLEAKRLKIQKELDEWKSPEERNRMGQFATSTVLARQILLFGTGLMPVDTPIRFLDPAIGTGSFFSALLNTVPTKRIENSIGYEIDDHYSLPSQELWQGTRLKIVKKDFTQSEPELKKANLIICNPPYVRHHHLDSAQKKRLQIRAEEVTGIQLSGLSGLYCYFMAIAHDFLADDGVAGWLVPSEFMGVNYGRMLKRYLINKVTLLRIHRYDPKDVQFDDALVSSAVVWFKKTPPPEDHKVVITYGGTLSEPRVSRKIPVSEMKTEPKWTRFPKASKASKTAETTLGTCLT